VTKKEERKKKPQDYNIMASLLHKAATIMMMMMMMMMMITRISQVFRDKTEISILLQSIIYFLSIPFCCMTVFS